MAKLSSIPDGTIVKIKINGVVRDCRTVGYNHYGKGEVTLMAPGNLIFSGFYSRTHYSGALTNAPIYQLTTYVGSRMDWLCNEVFPSMLPEEIAGSLVNVPISIFNVPSESAILRWPSPTEPSGSGDSASLFTGLNTQVGFDRTGNGWKGVLAYEGNSSGVTTWTTEGILADRCGFLFSVSELLGVSQKDITYSSVHGTGGHWNTSGIPRPKAYFDPETNRPSGYRTNGFTYLMSNSKTDITDEMVMRGGILVKGRMDTSTGAGDAAGKNVELAIPGFMYNAHYTLASSGTTTWLADALHLKGDHSLWASCEQPQYPKQFGFCLDGNCEVANSTGGITITKGTAIKTYRKLDGVWYRTI